MGNETQVRPVEGNWGTYSESDIALTTLTSFNLFAKLRPSLLHTLPSPAQVMADASSLSLVAMGLRSNFKNYLLEFLTLLCNFAKDFRLKTCGRKKKKCLIRRELRSV